MGYKVGSWLREYPLLAPSGREFTQPTAHFLIQLCTYETNSEIKL